MLHSSTQTSYRKSQYIGYFRIRHIPKTDIYPEYNPTMKQNKGWAWFEEANS
jgi:hypothetical protein